MILYFDGLCEPTNPGGLGCYGWVIKKAGKPDLTGNGALGHGSTNNAAEYQALIAGLRALTEMGAAGDIQVCGDSQLVINQVTGAWACRATHLRGLLQQARDLAQGLETNGARLQWRWVPREENTDADRQSRLAYNLARR